MRTLLFLSCILATIVLTGAQVNPVQQVQAINFELAFTQSDPVFGGPTTYTLYEKNGTRKTQIWSVTDHRKHLAHWISSNGTVWVLSDWGRVRDAGALWVRTRDAQRVADFNLGNASRCLVDQTKAEPLVPSNVDVAATEARVFGSYQVDQLDLKLKTGGTMRCTLIKPEHEGVLPVVRVFPAGQPITDLLSEAATSSSSRIELPVKEPRFFSVWTFPINGQTTLMERTDTIRSEEGPMFVQSESRMIAPPSHIALTPGGRVLWFEFPLGGNTALLRLLDTRGNEKQVIDLTRLGNFRGASDAKQSLLFRDAAVLRYNRAITLQDTDWYAFGQPEIIQINDRQGRTFRIDISKTESDAFTATAVASLNLDSAPAKEPVFADAKIVREESLASNNGLFRARLRRFALKEGDRNQMTLLSTITDPINGPKEIELWSVPMMDWPADVRVSDSGRVLQIQTGKWPQGPLKGKEYAMLITSEVSEAKSIGGLDLIMRGWFSSIADVKAHLKLAKLQLTIDGKKTQLDKNGIPIVFWSTERFAINGTDGKVYKLRVEAQPLPGLGQMIYFDK